MTWLNLSRPSVVCLNDVPECNIVPLFGHPLFVFSQEPGCSLQSVHCILSLEFHLIDPPDSIKIRRNHGIHITVFSFANWINFSSSKLQLLHVTTNCPLCMDDRPEGVPYWYDSINISASCFSISFKYHVIAIQKQGPHYIMIVTGGVLHSTKRPRNSFCGILRGMNTGTSQLIHLPVIVSEATPPSYHSFCHGPIPRWLWIIVLDLSPY